MTRRIGLLYPLITLILAAGLIFGCAKQPQPDPTSARELVARAYAAGASQLAAEEFRAARVALNNAERHIAAGEKQLAWDSLRLARKFAQDALKLTEQVKARRLEALRQRELVEDVEPVVVKPKTVKVPAPKPVPAPPPTPPEPVAEVVVRKGETLSNIAARKEVYGESLLWPLVYKANRDQIKDPKQIFPGQVLTIPRDKTEAEKEAAREEARNSELFR